MSTEMAANAHIADKRPGDGDGTENIPIYNGSDFLQTAGATELVGVKMQDVPEKGARCGQCALHAGMKVIIWVHIGLILENPTREEYNFIR